MIVVWMTVVYSLKVTLNGKGIKAFLNTFRSVFKTTLCCKVFSCRQKDLRLKLPYSWNSENNNYISKIVTKLESKTKIKLCFISGLPQTVDTKIVRTETVSGRRIFEFKSYRDGQLFQFNIPIDTRAATWKFYANYSEGCFPSPVSV